MHALRGFRRLSAVMVTASALVVAGLLAGAPVSAASGHGPGVRPLTRHFGLSFVPVVKILGATPHKPGFFSARTADGEKVMIPDYLRGRVQKNMKGGTAVPDLYDSKSGSCGNSFINITTKSNGDMLFRSTGFNLNPGNLAVYYSWSYTVSGPDYPPYTPTFGGVLAQDSSWANRVSSTPNYPNGTWSGAVSTGSYVVLTNGIICHSTGPSVHGYV